VISTKYGGFPVSVKIGLSFGPVDWEIIGAGKRKAYYFRGPAVEGCARAEHYAGKMHVVLDADMKQNLDDSAEAEKIEEGFYLLREIKTKDSQHSDMKMIKMKKKIVSEFIPSRIIDHVQKREFRDVVSVFVRFKGLKSHESINGYISDILEKTDKYGGYFNHLDFGDKGSNFLVFFGAPLSYEDNLIRACDY